jgi:plastocyanin
VTSNCVFAGKPPACASRAEPRTPLVQMTQSGANFVFNPANPKIEPGGCITFRSANVTHSASDNGCADDAVCGSPPVAACQYETGNVSSGAPNPTSTCFYSAATFPAGTGDGYFCRLHATATTGTMRGTIRVTTPIVLTVDKEVATTSVKLAWTGGGVTGDVTYKVARNSGGDPVMPAGTTTIVNPDGGVTGTTFTDAGELSSPTTKYYLVRNKQTSEPS